MADHYHYFKFKRDNHGELYVSVNTLVTALESWGQVADDPHLAAACMALAELLHKEVEEKV